MTDVKTGNSGSSYGPFLGLGGTYKENDEY